MQCGAAFAIAPIRARWTPGRSEISAAEYTVLYTQRALISDAVHRSESSAAERTVPSQSSPQRASKSPGMRSWKRAAQQSVLYPVNQAPSDPGRDQIMEELSAECPAARCVCIAYLLVLPVPRPRPLLPQRAAPQPHQRTAHYYYYITISDFSQLSISTIEILY